jgi:flagellar biogenesis protein FliO
MSEATMNTRSASYTDGRSLRQNILGRVLQMFQGLLPASAAPKRLISIEERMEIGPKKTLMLVNCAGRRFLLATTGDSIAPLGEIRPTENGLTTRVAVTGYLGSHP